MSILYRTVLSPAFACLVLTTIAGFSAVASAQSNAAPQGDDDVPLKILILGHCVQELTAKANPALARKDCNCMTDQVGARLTGRDKIMFSLPASSHGGTAAEMDALALRVKNEMPKTAQSCGVKS